MTMMMTIMIVLRKQLAHITRGRRRRQRRRQRQRPYLPFGKDSINPEKNQISGEAGAGRGPISLIFCQPPPSPPFVMD